MTRMAAVLAAVLLVTGSASVTPGVHAQSSATLVSGHTWTDMSDAARVAYVAGMTNLVELERARPGAAGLTNSESFSRYLVRGLQGRTLRQIVERVNGYYRAHPSELDRPVVDVIVRTFVIADAGRRS